MHLQHDEPDKAKYYVGEEKAYHFSTFEVLCVVDMEDTAIMHQTILVELNDGINLTASELEAMFDDDNMYGIKAVDVSCEPEYAQRFMVSLTHSY